VFGIPAVLAIVIATKLVVFTENALTYGTLAVLLALCAGLFVTMFARAEPGDRNRILALIGLFFGAAVFFFVFEQASSTFNLFARDHTDNSILGLSFPPTFWQSVNSVFIIAFAPVFAAIWLWLAKRDRNPSWPLKFGIGLVLLALGCLVMLPATATVGAGGKAGPQYLLLLYLLHTFAELCLSPVGLSATTKVAPSRIAGLAMGIWFAGTAVGNYMAGVAGGWTEKLSLPVLFVSIAIPPLVAAAVFFALIRPLRRMVKDV
jgi:POT family proton-dependent oligopeptide transporter